MTMATLLCVAALFTVSWIYYSVKQNVKRNLLFRDQYTRQRVLTHRNLVVTTSASIADVKRSLAEHVVVDDSVRGAFTGGATTLQSQSPTKLVYHHSSRITTGGRGDEFTASITFAPIDPGLVRAVVSIDRWREKDGVTRRAGIKAMEDFVNAAAAAFQAADPRARLDYA
jgi:hypothetical protein